MFKILNAFFVNLFKSLVVYLGISRIKGGIRIKGSSSSHYSEI